ncbi:MAG: hypothetical protein AAGA20_22105, partial [Planctomycetota bacterium]
MSGSSADDLEPVVGERRRQYRTLVADVKQALLSEIGARAVYDHIARRARDEDLARLAAAFN